MRKPVRVAIALSAIALVAIMLAVPFYTSTAAAIDSTGTARSSERRRADS